MKHRYQLDFSADEQGFYAAPGLPVSEYEVSAGMAGFKRSVRSGITLQVNQNAEVAMRLESGQVAEAVEVTGQAPLVNTTNATVGEVIENRRVRDLPLAGRSALALALLGTGVISNAGPTNSGFGSFNCDIQDMVTSGAHQVQINAKKRSQLKKSVDPADVAQRSVVTVLYELPSGKGKLPSAGDSVEHSVRTIELNLVTETSKFTGRQLPSGDRWREPKFHLWHGQFSTRCADHSVGTEGDCLTFVAINPHPLAAMDSAATPSRRARRPLSNHSPHDKVLMRTGYPDFALLKSTAVQDSHVTLRVTVSVDQIVRVIDEQIAADSGSDPQKGPGD